MTKVKPARAAPAKAEPSERDIAVMSEAATLILARRKRVALAVTGEGTALQVGSPHSDAHGHSAQLLDAFGTTSLDFAEATLNQLLNAVSDRGATANAGAINAAMAIVAGAEASSEVEALLASQMAATHGLAMILIGRTRRADELRQMEANGGLAVKLLRTFTAQAETLAKLRRGGGQTVRVEHVHVHAGGQAVVGNVMPGGGAQLKSEDQPHAKHVPALDHADAPFDPLRSTDAKRHPVPIPRHA